ncbi:MAG: hypothetical protein JO353_05495 [Phycisphaerae bacterium]|nr:hypothetical protein [Phycisphaerae bacterium]
MMCRFSGLAIGLFSAIAIGAATTSESPIVIDHEPPVATRIMFDRFHKNPNMPATQPGEAALTQSNFECAVSIKYQVMSQHKTGDQWHVMVRIGQAHVHTALVDTIYLPQMAPVELRAHEEGHRVMNERVYEEGESIAQQAAGKLLDGEWPGEGKDVDAAGKAATNRAIAKFSDVYLQHTSRRASALGDIYDKLTNHGRNSLIVANAIKLSFEEERKIAATQPATTQIDLRP